MLNTVALQEAYENNELLSDLFNYFYEERTNNYKETMRKQLGKQLSRYTGRKIGQSEMRKLFKTLEELECGHYTQGRYARIVWSAPMLEIATCAVGQQRVPIECKDNFESNVEEMLLHRLNLRNDFEFSIELPVDLTSSESWRLGHLSKGLAHNPSSLNKKVEFYELPLREGVQIKFGVPNNLTFAEAERLDSFFIALPIEDDDYACEEEGF